MKTSDHNGKLWEDTKIIIKKCKELGKEIQVAIKKEMEEENYIDNSGYIGDFVKNLMEELSGFIDESAKINEDYIHERIETELNNTFARNENYDMNGAYRCCYYIDRAGLEAWRSKYERDSREETLIERLERAINQQFYLVKDLLEEVQEGETTMEELKDTLATGLHDFRLVRNILGTDEREQAITDKIIRIKIAVEAIEEGDIKQALFSLTHTY
jgi:hypothetical protein